eukprot:TRINITY_DN3832_c0_g1_i1.p2 TRINITY_DN3832_c0_g1~~TRINITY_DN3832_c0_g1_i1.p2  ORF type:complete len:64 (+),score=15.16 TRINITY_DN3832_c0_g1_i1:109-300(+)
MDNGFRFECGCCHGALDAYTKTQSSKSFRSDDSVVGEESSSEGIVVSLYETKSDEEVSLEQEF